MYRLDPRKTPRENLFNCIVQVETYLFYRRKLKLYPDEYHDLMTAWTISTFLSFKRRVLTGKYSREHPLWNNVFACAWSTFSSVWIHEKNIIRRRMNQNSVYDTPKSCEDGDRFIDTLVSNCMKFMAQHHEPVGAPPRPVLECPVYLEEQYETHLADCEEFGIAPCTVDEFLRRNCVDPETCPRDTGSYKKWLDRLNRRQRARRQISSSKSSSSSDNESSSASTSL